MLDRLPSGGLGQVLITKYLRAGEVGEGVPKLYPMKCPHLMCNAVMQGYRVRHLMSPRLKGVTFEERQGWFDLHLENKFSGGSLYSDLPAQVVSFMRKFKDPTVALIYMLGNTVGWELECGDNTLVASTSVGGKREFGVRNGVILSRFYAGEACQIDVSELFDEPVCYINNLEVGTLIIRAGRNLDAVGKIAALVILRGMELAGVKDFEQFVRLHSDSANDDDAKVLEIEDICSEILIADDPLAEAYLLCVPEKLTVRQFNNLVGSDWRDRRKQGDSVNNHHLAMAIKRSLTRRLKKIV